MYEFEKDKEENEFYLQGKIRIMHKGYKDWKGRQYDDDLAILEISKESRDAWPFFNAWTPKARGEAFEIIIQAAYPLNEYMKVAVCVPDDLCKEFYLFIMSMGPLEYLSEHKSALNGKKVGITVFPASMEQHYEQFIRPASRSYDPVETAMVNERSLDPNKTIERQWTK